MDLNSSSKVAKRLSKSTTRMRGGIFLEMVTLITSTRTSEKASNKKLTSMTLNLKECLERPTNVTKRFELILSPVIKRVSSEAVMILTTLGQRMVPLTDLGTTQHHGKREVSTGSAEVVEVVVEHSTHLATANVCLSQ
jgi:hypothetical protein